MKKNISLYVTIFWMIPAILTLCLAFAGCKDSDSLLKTVRLNEVAHSIFYAPMYVALEQGYFEEEGLNIELTTGFGVIH